MIKELFLSSSNKNNNKINNTKGNDSTILLTEIPFCGLAGTISRIEETKDSYYKVLYNADGTINKTKLPVPKKKNKNKKNLFNDYYNDLEKYLDRNKAKYLEFKNTNIIPKLSKKQFLALATVTSLASLASLPLLLSTTFVGLMFGTISVFSLYVVCEVYKKDKDEIIKRNNFVNDYDQYQRNFVDYKAKNESNKAVTPKTQYTEIDCTKKNNEKEPAKSKQLIKTDTAQTSIN